MKDYIIIESEKAIETSEVVRNLLNEGWELYGEPTFVPFFGEIRYIQTLVKKE